MSEHECVQEPIILGVAEDVSELKVMVKELDNSLRGNGGPGLFTEFAVWKNTVLGLLALDVVIVTAIVAMWFKA